MNPLSTSTYKHDQIDVFMLPGILEKSMENISISESEDK